MVKLYPITQSWESDKHKEEALLLKNWQSSYHGQFNLSINQSAFLAF